MANDRGNNGFPGMSNFDPGTLLQGLFSMLGDYAAESAVKEFFQAITEEDYETAYELLAEESPLRSGLSAEEWAEQFQSWIAQAGVSALQFDVVLPPADEEDEFEDEDEEGEEGEDEEDEEPGPPPPLRFPSPLTSLFGGENTGPTSKEVEVFWSQRIAHPNQASQIPLQPTATLVSPDTSRHWFWTRFTLLQRNNNWYINELIDDGAELLQHSVPELQAEYVELTERLGELAEELEEESANLEGVEEEDEDEELDIDEEDEDEDEEDVGGLFGDIDMEEFSTITGHLQEAYWLAKRSLYYQDALITKQADDYEIYDSAYEQAGNFQDMERAATYALLASERFPEDRLDALKSYAAALMQMLVMARQEEGTPLPEEQRKSYEQKIEQIGNEIISTENAPLGYLLLARLFMIQGNRVDEAEKLLRQVQDLELEEEDRILAKIGLAQLEESRGNTREALKYYQQAADIQPELPRIWINIGHLQNELGQMGNAAQSFERSIEQDPNETDAYAELAAIYTRQNKLPQAEAILEEGLEINPDSVDILASLALVYINGGELKAAEEFLDEAEEIDPEHPLAQTARQQFNAAKAQQRQRARDKGQQRKSSHRHKHKK